mgnify:CR=1 FL=1
MKFNKSKIFKKAWELKRALNKTLSVALKMAWALAKRAMKLRKEWDEPNGKIEFNIWAKYGKLRAYYTCSFRSNYQNNKGFYVDLAKIA